MAARQIGFVLVTHNQPAQTAFLCRRLTALFGEPPIAIHHDYSQTFLDPATLPPHVRVVEKWVKTGWGAPSVIDAYLAALRLLHTKDAPEWTMNLSAADYPIKSAQQIEDDLRSADADVYLDFRDISHGAVQPQDAHSEAAAFHLPEYMRLARKRYLDFSAVHYHLRRWFGREQESIYVSNRVTNFVLTPFSGSYRPYAGDWWHTVNRRAVEVLLAPDRKARALRRFYENRASAEESYFHSVLVNQQGLRVENNNRRFTVWEPDSAHPRTLAVSDIPQMMNSPAHFARKFPYDEGVYRAVDEAIAFRCEDSSNAPPTPLHG